VQLEVSESESRHLKEQLAINTKALMEKESALAEARSLVSKRSAGFSAMEKDLADKNAEVKRLTRELAAKNQEAPKVETKEVIVEKMPEALSNLQDALEVALADLRKAETAKVQARREVEELEAQAEAKRADLEASQAVHASLQEVIAAWEPFAGKFSTAQLVVQAAKNPDPYKPALKAMAGMLQKFLSEINAAL
jgi:chromosome segregation ATPase